MTTARSRNARCYAISLMQCTMGAPDAPRVLAGPVRALSHNLQCCQRSSQASAAARWLRQGRAHGVGLAPNGLPAGAHRHPSAPQGRRSNPRKPSFPSGAVTAKITPLEVPNVRTGDLSSAGGAHEYGGKPAHRAVSTVDHRTPDRETVGT